LDPGLDGLQSAPRDRPRPPVRDRREVQLLSDGRGAVRVVATFSAPLRRGLLFGLGSIASAAAARLDDASATRYKDARAGPASRPSFRTRFPVPTHGRHA